MPNNQLSLKDITPVDALHFEPISPRYRSVQIALTALGYIILAALALLLLLIDNPLWCIITEGVIIVAMAVNIAIARKAWKFKGYALRDKDISYRTGLIFPKVTTIPYEKLQQVSVKQNPISKLFGLYGVEVMNGAQTLASISIPGLSKERANQIENIIIEKMKDEQP